MREIHRSPLNSQHRGQWLGALIIFDLHLNKRVSKQSCGWWFETPLYPLWRHCNASDSDELTMLPILLNVKDNVHDDVIKWKRFPRNWPFARGIHRSPLNSQHRGQWLGALIIFDLHLNKRVSKQSCVWWFETPLYPLWRHCNASDSDELTMVPILLNVKNNVHDDVIKWKHFPRNWPFARGIHRSPVNSTHKGQWRGALMFSLICGRINGWVNNGEAGDLRRYRVHCDVMLMFPVIPTIIYVKVLTLRHPVHIDPPSVFGLNL